MWGLSGPFIFRMTGISESCEQNFSIRTFTGRARHFAYGETVREAPLVATGKISESAPLFFFGMSLGHSLLSRVFQFEATA